MSLRVLVLAEDITHDQHIACPVVRGTLAALGQAQAVVRPCLDPRFQGFTQATDPAALRDVYAIYPMVDLFVLCVDRDGEDGRADVIGRLEAGAAKAGATLFGLVAHQEIEAWALAGCSDFKPRSFGLASWRAVRTDPDVKERAFEPFADARGVALGVGGGRKALGQEAGRANASRVRAKCPEVAAFSDRIQVWLDERTAS